MKNNTPDDIDNAVLILLQKVDAKKAQIGLAERPSWQTNCMFAYIPEHNARVNIQTFTDFGDLVSVYSFISDKKETFDKHSKELGVQASFKWMGFTADQWKSDIKTRLSQLQLKLKKDELSALEQRVNALVSPEQRRRIELEKLVKEVD